MKTKMQKILHINTRNTKRLQKPENWTPYNQLNHLHQTLQKQGDQK